MDYISLLPNDIYYEMCHYLQQIDLITMKYINTSCYQLTKFYIDKFVINKVVKIFNFDVYKLYYYCSNNFAIDLAKYIIYDKPEQRYYIMFESIKTSFQDNDIRLFKYLIELHPKTIYLDRIIEIAITRQSYTILKFCIDYPIHDINILLIYASQYYDINIINLLINKGDNNVSTLNSALTKACICENTDICELLISKGADKCHSPYIIHQH